MGITKPKEKSIVEVGRGKEDSIVQTDNTEVADKYMNYLLSIMMKIMILKL